MSSFVQVFLNGRLRMINRNSINDDRAKLISETLSDPQKCKEMVVAHFFPLERFKNPLETKEEYVERRFKEICETLIKKKE
jgi:pyruvate-formate lyase-activating enzyme